MFRDKSYKTIFIAYCIIIISVLLFGCRSVSSNPSSRNLLDWKYSDLKLVDPLDAVEPGQDLIATYARINDHRLQLRIDFLQLDKYLGKDIYIPIDTNPGGVTQIVASNSSTVLSDISWDYLIKFTDAGDIELVDNHLGVVNGVQLFIVYDSEQDRIVIDIIHSIIPIIYGQTKFQVIITPPGSEVISDKSEIFSTDTPSPARAKVLFAFWNTFSSETPAQTLRSWAGAHAGPMSSRHGLRYLIDAAERTNSTIFLLDLLTPNNLSALDYLDVLPRIRKLADQGILGLPPMGMKRDLGKPQTASSSTYSGNVNYDPNVYPEWVINNNLANIDTRSASILILLLDNKFNISNYSYVFGVNDNAQFDSNLSSCNLFPILKNSTPSQGELSLDCKRLLVSNTYDQPSSPLFLGGDFSNSSLGDPALSIQAFSYIAVHPWIQVLTIQDLATADKSSLGYPRPNQNAQSKANLESRQAESNATTSGSNIQRKVYDALLKAPHNQLTDLAWQVYYSTLQPVSPELLSLRENYIGQIGQILTAAAWAEAPSVIQTCTIDLDFDGKNECILANNHIFVVIERAGGYISFVFTVDAKGIHQIIGPTWEFIIGLSDPSSWDTQLGVRSDSAQILGAFQDQFYGWNYYNVNISEGKIELFNNKMTMRKTISVYPDKIHLDIQITDPSEITPSIPLVVDPWKRYTRDWGDSYKLVKEPFGVNWGIVHSKMVGVYSTNPVTSFTFNATHKALLNPEDPNFDYSRGHYLPFPMAVVEITSSDTYSVDIGVNP